MKRFQFLPDRIFHFLICFPFIGLCGKVSLVAPLLVSLVAPLLVSLFAPLLVSQFSLVVYSCAFM